MTDYEKLCLEVREELKEQISMLNCSFSGDDEFNWKQFAQELEAKGIKHYLIDSVAGWFHSEILIDLFKGFSFAVVEKRTQVFRPVRPKFGFRSVIVEETSRGGATVSLVSNDKLLKMEITEIPLNSNSVTLLSELTDAGKKVINKYSEKLMTEIQRRKEESEKVAASAYSSGITEDDINYDLKNFISDLINRQTDEIKKYIDQKIYGIFSVIAENLKNENVVMDSRTSMNSIEEFCYDKLKKFGLNEELLSETDSVSKLYHIAKQGYIKVPEYEYSEYEKSWICNCLIGKNTKVSGVADSKKEAKKLAANQAIAAIIKNGKIEVSDEVKMKFNVK